jgi:NAD(P)-dependent dehydrogenase (short-subunit alcohol dehydrogenase family)
MRAHLVNEIPLGRPGEPEDIVGMACFLASDEASYLTGSDIIIDGGRTAG